MLTRSSVILIVIIWLICAVYGGIAKIYGYPYGAAAIVVAWVMSAIMLVAIAFFIKKHRQNQG